jgi:ATP-dependent DNA helicase PIF1
MTLSLVGLYLCAVSEISVAEIAFDIVENTKRNVFLTGEAGTGKTTFLKKLLQHTEKNCIVVAPTGVAAINAGGSTIHSMFGLPTRMFVPTMEAVDPNIAQNIPMLQGHFHYPKPKLDLFKRVELLIIDEISMVRSDLFDAIDESLRFSRRSFLPFGGVQVLLIGDLFQLPPVVRQHEKSALMEFYRSEFFFDSRVYSSLNVLQLKLNKVYRQTHRAFIGLLNNIRNAELDQGDFELLQERFQPDFEPDEDGFVTLCSHNNTAERINEEQLKALPGEYDTYHAEIQGEFFENQYPLEPILKLKVGAQVMFMKNDTSGEKKYYNGKIGIVSELGRDKIIVEDPKNGKLIEVERENWQNLKYVLDKGSDAVTQEEIGNFKQFPLKLAWAITIHKSQGLTLEKVIIDAERSFAPGQVYVALSRAVSLDGLYLKSGITGRNIILDPRIVTYSSQNAPVHELPGLLEQEKREHAKEKLLQKFEFEGLRNYGSAWYDKLYRKHEKALPVEISQWIHPFIAKTNQLEQVMHKFRHELKGIFASHEHPEPLELELFNRCQKAIGYCVQELDLHLLKPAMERSYYFLKKPKSKRWHTAMEDLVKAMISKREQLLQLKYLNQSLHPDKVSLPEIVPNTK